MFPADVLPIDLHNKQKHSCSQTTLFSDSIALHQEKTVLLGYYLVFKTLDINVWTRLSKKSTLLLLQ